MSVLGIKYMDYYVAEEELTVENLVNQVEVEAIPAAFSSKGEYKQFANTILELESVRVENVFTKFEVLERLLDKMFNTDVVKRSDIDLIILVEERTASSGNNIAQQLQYKFNLTNAFIFNASGNHCANLEVVISTISQIQNSDINNVLILNSTKVDSVKDRIIGSYGILGDAAGVILLSRDESRLKIINSCVENNGQLYQADPEKDNNLLHSKYLMKCVKKVMDKSDYTLEDVSKLIIQNANPLLYSYILANAGLNTDKIYNSNFGKYGHLDCLDFLVNLHDATKEQRHKRGDLILSVGMGWAGAYVSILFSVN